MHRCVVRDSNLGHQLLLPPAKLCPTFASRATLAWLQPAAAALFLEKTSAVSEQESLPFLEVLLHLRPGPRRA